MAQAKTKADHAGETPLLEWIAAAIGLLLTLTVAGVIAREALSGETAQVPVISVAVTGVASAPPGYGVAFEARNRSGGTAREVEIEATLKDGEAVVETATAMLDYVPGHGNARGAVFFTSDPRRHDLEIRALGVQLP